MNGVRTPPANTGGDAAARYQAKRVHMVTIPPRTGNRLTHAAHWGDNEGSVGDADDRGGATGAHCSHKTVSLGL